MNDQRTPLEWYVGEEPPRPPQPEAPPSVAGGRRRLLFFFLGTLLLIAVIVLLWRLRYTQAVRAIRADIEQQVERERDAIRLGDDVILSTLLDPEAPEVWRAAREFEWEHLYHQEIPLRVKAFHLLTGDLAAVSVQGWPRAPYTRGRLYRHLAGRWYWTAASVALWGDTLDPLSLSCGQVQAREMDDSVLGGIRERETEVCDRLTALLGGGGTLRIDPEAEWPFVDRGASLVVVPSPWLLGLDASESVDDALVRTLDTMVAAVQGIETSRRREETYLRAYLQEGYLEGQPRAEAMAQYAEKDVVDTLVRFVPLFVSPSPRLPTRLDAPLRLERMRLMGDWAWVVMSGKDDIRNIPWYVVRFYHRQPDGRWLWAQGDVLAWGPRLRLNSKCLSVTYRSISGPVVRAVWEDWKSMCGRSLDAFSIPERVPLRMLLSDEASSEANISTRDLVMTDPARWIIPLPGPPEDGLRVLFATDLTLLIMKPIPVEGGSPPIYPFKVGMTIAYLLPLEVDIVPWGSPPAAWPTSYERLQELSYDAQVLVGYQVGRYIRRQVGDKALLAWLRMVRYTAISADIANESSNLTVGMSFDALLRAAEAK